VFWVASRTAPVTLPPLWPGATVPTGVAIDLGAVRMRRTARRLAPELDPELGEEDLALSRAALGCVDPPPADLDRSAAADDDDGSEPPVWCLEALDVELSRVAFAVAVAVAVAARRGSAAPAGARIVARSGVALLAWCAGNVCAVRAAAVDG